MKGVFELLEDKGIDTVKISGTYNFDVQNDLLKEMASQHKKNNTKKSLWDFRDAEVMGSIMSLFERPKLYEQSGLKRSTKAALLFNVLNKDWLFLENVCVNRGWDIKLFIDYDAAIEWLTKQVGGLLRNLAVPADGSGMWHLNFIVKKCPRNHDL